MIIRKAGLLVVRDGRILLCRKARGTSLLILPGGKFEAGESAEACIARELREELDVGVAGLEYVGTYREQAADAADCVIEIELYRGEILGEPRASAEIAGFEWFGADGDRERLAPSLARRILPDLIARRMIAL